MLNAKAWSLAGVVGAVLAAGATAPASAAMISFETVALTGDTAPGTGGAAFSRFDGPVLNDNGDVAFRGVLAGPGVTGSNDSGIFAESAGVLGLVAREGGTVPGTGGATFRSLGGFALNDNGDTAFAGRLTGGGATPFNDEAIFAVRAGALSLVAREGDTVPGTGGGAYSFFVGSPALNDSGDTAFRGFVSGGGGDRGIFAESAGVLGVVARRDDTAPGTGGAVFDLFGDPALNDNGDTAFLSRLAGAGVTRSNDRGLFAESGGTLGLVARQGDTAPGTGGAAFAGFAGPALNNNGDIAFRGSLAGAGVAPGNDRGIFAERGGVLGLVAREGDTAPGTGGAAFSDFVLPALNDAGDIAFWGFLSGAGVTGSNDSGLWFGANGGPLELIVREGDLLEVAPGDSRTVDLLTVFGSNSGFFNDADQLAFLARFSDGSQGVFVATVDGVTAVPAPGSVAVLAAGLAGLALLRRRRPQAA